MSHGRVTSLELIGAVVLCGAAEAYLRSGTASRATIILLVLAAYVVAEVLVAREERIRARRIS